MTKRHYRVLARILWVFDILFCLVGLWWWGLFGVSSHAGEATIWTAVLLTVVAGVATAAGE